MIAVDSSAVVAVFRKEPEGLRFLDRMLSETSAISAASVLECSIVMRLARVLPADRAEKWLDKLLADLRIEILPVTLDHLSIARWAHARFGKGTGHGAGLNFGDCFSYALAKALDVPLLYKGGDFGRTDIVSAIGA